MRSSTLAEASPHTATTSVTDNAVYVRSLINALPTELLAEIFKVTHAEWPVRRCLEVITSVCSRWRSIALKTASLWANIEIRLNAKSFRASIAIFKRTQSALINVLVKEDTKKLLPRREALLKQTLLKYSHRMEKLQVMAVNQTHFDNLFPLFSPNAARIDISYLLHLGLFCKTLFRDETVHFTNWVSSNRLRTLRLGNINVENLPIAPNLAHLYSTQINPDRKTFCDIFTRYPLLETLGIDFPPGTSALIAGQPGTLGLIGGHHSGDARALTNVPPSLHTFAVKKANCPNMCQCYISELFKIDTIKSFELMEQYWDGHRLFPAPDVFSSWNTSSSVRELLLHCNYLHIDDLPALTSLPPSTHLKLFSLIDNTRNRKLDKEFPAASELKIVTAVLSLTNLRLLTLDFRDRPEHGNLEVFIQVVERALPVLGSPTVIDVREDTWYRLEAKIWECFSESRGREKLTIRKSSHGAPISLLHSVMSIQRAPFSCKWVHKEKSIWYDSDSDSA